MRVAVVLALALVAAAAPAQNGRTCATRELGADERQRVRAEVAAHKERRAAGPRADLLIDIVYHVIHADGVGKVSAAMVEDQTQAMNRAYAGTADTVPAGLRFRTADIAFVNNQRWHNRCEGQEDNIQTALQRDPTKFLNVYVCDLGDTLGYAYLPQDFPETSKRHGVFLHHETLPGGTAPYDLGYTLVHEAGHYFGLEHTFAEGGVASEKCTSADDDGFSQTPFEKRPYYGCGAERDSCPDQPGFDPRWNFLDYSDDRCMTHFVPQQVDFMRNMLEIHKPKLVAHSTVSGPTAGPATTDPTSTSTAVTGNPCDTLGWTQLAQHGVCTSTVLEQNCKTEHTHAEAKSMCESVGGRLCTKRELKRLNIRPSDDHLCAGYGRNHHWTGTSCSSNAFTTVKRNRRTSCRPATNTARVQCCADMTL